jgi:hypothetical protein
MTTMARLDLTSLDVTSFELQGRTPQTSDANLAAYPYCCTGCDSGCGIFPTAGGCQSGGKTYDAECTVLSAYPCDSVDICEG